MSPRPATEKQRRRSTYTLVEIVAVLVVMVVLTAVVVTRIPSRPSLQTETALLCANLRYAQTRAMADSGSVWSVAISATGYTLLRDGIPASLPWPGSDSPVHILSASVQISLGTGTLVYDSWGNPGAADRSITLTQGDGTSTVTVVGITGFVQ